MPSLTLPTLGLVTFDLAFEATPPSVENPRRFDVAPEGYSLRIDWIAPSTRIPVHVWLKPSVEGLRIRVEASSGPEPEPLGEAELIVHTSGKVTGVTR